MAIGLRLHSGRASASTSNIALFKQQIGLSAVPLDADASHL
jgi:hypothetical protein